MLTVALSQVARHSRRYIAVGLAVMLGVGFLAATLMVGGTTTATLQNSIGAEYSKADLVVSNDDGTPLPPDAAARAQDVAGVAAVHAEVGSAMALQASDTATIAMIDTLAPPSLEALTLTEGRLPERNGEVTIDATAADQLAVSLGDPVQGAALTAATPDESIKAGGTELRVVGISTPSHHPFMSGMIHLHAVETQVTTLAAEASASRLQVALTDGGDPAVVGPVLAQAVNDAGASVAVLTAAEQTTADVAALSGGQDQLTIVLLAFAVVAVLVTGLVISNTFSVLVAQRTRELALLRCIGADRRQIRRSVLIEAAVVGLVASALGVLLAVAVMWTLVSIARAIPGSEFATLAVPVHAVVASMVVGLLMTLAAALVPARAATAVAPLAALRPVDHAGITTRRGRLRLGIGVALVVAGGLILALGAAQANLLIALPGGVLSFLGLLLCAGLFVPALVTQAGRLAQPFGVPGRLAAVNAVRNPGRTTATASALLVGVTLVSMMMSGAQTSRTAFDSALAQNYPVDLAVQLEGGDSAEAAQVLRSLEGVEAVTRPAAVARVSGEDGDQVVYSLSPAQAKEVLRPESASPRDGAVVMPDGTEATSLEVTGSAGSRTFDVVVAESRTIVPLITEAAAEQLGPLEEVDGSSMLWLKLDDSLESGDITALRTEIVDALGLPEYLVSGAALERATFNQIIDVLLLVVIALLAVAVLIALIGVANTLSLSVHERTRESALLRALGLTRGQLRSMLAVEAVLIAGVAALIGVGLGMLYGWLGAQSALGLVAEVTASFPWLQLAGVLAVAILAGLAASVLPARRATRLSPVEGLAVDG
ncbi:FtsX-like permease family protein [Arthrobacter sp. JZ12]|uniref:ABC transporter permease n=1 Tax=Arthrobacter sp. JZ12 TaxID=2654190 RepID=UPI002B498B82|nr:ABC transporter permease [Arthrobacter sp. JZ12]WRH25184.1 FtsX-like permease family protein [Arthrobacter sp. JZ12]